ncbi:ATP-dependent zinc protease family protein [Candidatus Enterovibrio altilux]|uniref:ATP-dependent zinc protease family protein n=1 Tax=Candidatus Enterovibrio altilux TaxID=1927128 RepID=UPI0012380317|nr:ATP-dependent zinc protease [Candidatus Enterovibrio luxaltus]
MTDNNTSHTAHDENLNLIQANTRTLVGWREWVGLPELNIQAIKAKVDTGARTSCLHTFGIKEYKKDGKKWVKFGVHPKQGDITIEHECHAKVFDMRTVRDSGGHETYRYVIETRLKIGYLCYPIKMTLTTRDNMKFHMLLGRTAMEGQLLVEPEASFILQAPQG